jgi:hypothetical protein
MSLPIATSWDSSRVYAALGPKGIWYRAASLSARSHLAPAKQHAHHHKDEVIVTAAQRIIARFFGVATRWAQRYNLYYLSFRDGMIARPRELSLAGAAGAASGDAATAARSPERRDRLLFDAGAREALRLVGGAFCIGFLVF